MRIFRETNGKYLWVLFVLFVIAHSCRITSHYDYAYRRNWASMKAA
jgi:hypothetical protein